MKVQIVPKIQTLRNSTKRYRVAVGGRGSAKSFGIATCFVLKAIQEPCKLLCTRNYQNSINDSSMAIIKRVIEHYDLMALFDVGRNYIRCKNGSEFIFKGLQNSEEIKSLDGVKYCWVEEAAKVGFQAFDDLKNTIRENGSEIWLSFNPDLEDDYIYNLFVVNNHTMAATVKMDYMDNPFFPDSLREEMEYDKQYNYEKYLHVWEGQPATITEAQIFKGKFRVADFKTPEDAVFYYGADWGFSSDPNALVRCFVKDQSLFIDYESYSYHTELDDIPAMFESVPGSKQWTITADNARPETISFLNQRGFSFQACKKGPDSIKEGIEYIRSFKEIVIHERCPHTLSEFKKYSYKIDKNTGNILPVIIDAYNHAIDALRYALERLRHTGPQVRFL